MNDDPQRKTPGGVTGKGFVKGDPRINREGRSPSFDELRRAAQMIAGEDVVGADGNTITRAELLLRQWSRSKNPMLQKLFVEIAFGPVPPTKVEANGLESQKQIKLVLRYGHERPRSRTHGDCLPRAEQAFPELAQPGSWARSKPEAGLGNASELRCFPAV